MYAIVTTALIGAILSGALLMTSVAQAALPPLSYNPVVEQSVRTVVNDVFDDVMLDPSLMPSRMTLDRESFLLSDTTVQPDPRLLALEYQLFQQ